MQHEISQERHADPIDIAANSASIGLNSTIQAIRQNAEKMEVEATGECLFCGEELDQSGPVPMRWCDADCRDKWEKSRR